MSNSILVKILNGWKYLFEDLDEKINLERPLISDKWVQLPVFTILNENINFICIPVDLVDFWYIGMAKLFVDLYFPL